MRYCCMKKLNILKTKKTNKNSLVSLHALHVVLLLFACMLLSCSKPSPENYFDRAVLNSNLIARFGEEELSEFVKRPAQAYNPGTKQMEKSTYVEAFQGNIDRVKDFQKKMLKLPVTDETSNMITASKKFYEFVLDKYENDYVRILKMKDDGRNMAAVQKAIREFDQKYKAEFIQLQGTLIQHGLEYATKHGIKVNVR